MPDDTRIEADIPAELDEELSRLASARGETKAELVHRAIVEFARRTAAFDEISPNVSQRRKSSPFLRSQLDPHTQLHQMGLAVEPPSVRWDVFDVLCLVGIAIGMAGFIAALFLALRALGWLVPLGFACMTFAAYGAQRRDARAG